MPLKAASTGGTDLRSKSYVIQPGYSFPTAKVTEEGRQAQRQGATPCEAHYSDAPFTLPITVRGSSSADVDAKVDALTASLRENGITLSEGGARMSTAIFLDLQVDTRASRSKWATVVYSGTRRPGWRGATSTHALTFAGGIGTADVTGTGGDLAADTDATITTGAATNLVGIGLWPSPQAGYAPIDDYNDGAADGAALGGNWGANTPVGTTPNPHGTAPGRSVNDNRGGHYALAHVKNNATTPSNVRLSVETSNSGATKALPSVPVPLAAANVLLGKIRIPVAEVPDGPSGVAYAAEALLEESTGGTYYYSVVGGNIIDGANPPRMSAVLTAAASLVPEIELDLDNGCTEVLVTMRSRQTSKSSVWRFTGPASGMAYRRGVWQSGTAGQDGTLPAGTYDLEAITPRGGAAATPWCKVRTIMTGLMNHRFYTRALITFDAQNTVKGTCSEGTKTSNLDALTRIPSDHGAIIVARTFGAGAGFTYAGGNVYPYSGGVVTGAAIAATLSEAAFALPPGDARVVLHAGAGADAHAELKVTEVHLGLA
jgi:hypothetical protein